MISTRLAFVTTANEVDLWVVDGWPTVRKWHYIFFVKLRFQRKEEGLGRVTISSSKSQPVPYVKSSKVDSLVAGLGVSVSWLWTRIGCHCQISEICRWRVDRVTSWLYSVGAGPPSFWSQFEHWPLHNMVGYKGRGVTGVT